jgi:hypothetical protein
MGAFFLYHKDSSINETAVENLYLLKGFKYPFRMLLGDYKLLQFRKQYIDTVNYYKVDQKYIFVTGTLVYKGLSYNQSLQILLQDFNESCIDSNELNGNYTILIFNEITKILTFCPDPSFIKNVYFDPEKKIISTDFLALVEAFPGSYSLNRQALIESLVTGHLISPDTYANEIQKLDQVNINSLASNFTGFETRIFIPSLVDNIESFKTALQDADSKLSKYFKSLSNLTNEYGVHIGITGGFDSRLLLIYAKKYLNRFNTNSFWRKGSADYVNAREVAKKANVPFISFEDKPFLKQPKEVMFRNSYYFFDGQVRSQNRWDEEFNSPEYIVQIASGHFVGLHGCGGEQYRNADRIIRRISLKDYILYEWMFKQSPDVFNDRNLKGEIFENIKKKMLRLVKIDYGKVGLFELKKIQNEIWNGANRATRVNAINQYMFYFAPFTEYVISQSAYSYGPYLGNSFLFQTEMIRNLDPVLAGIKTNYGFNLTEGESFTLKVIPFIINYIPKPVFNRIYLTIKNHGHKDSNIGGFLQTAQPEFLSLVKGIDLGRLYSNRNLGAGVDAINYFVANANLRLNCK